MVKLEWQERRGEGGQENTVAQLKEGNTGRNITFSSQQKDKKTVV